MFEIVKSISFCYGHRLLNYLGPCANLHGHNARADIHLTSETLDERGMIMDFSDIKREVKTWLDDTLDHTMLLAKEDPVIPYLNKAKERYFLMDKNPTAENIAELIFNKVESLGYPIKAVTLWETETSYARFSK
jgi:6-pyruvoyltetrahydropterin/6-carboxytetrahydropterin synthase